MEMVVIVIVSSSIDIVALAVAAEADLTDTNWIQWVLCTRFSRKSSQTFTPVRASGVITGMTGFTSVWGLALIYIYHIKKKVLHEIEGSEYRRQEVNNKHSSRNVVRVSAPGNKHEIFEPQNLTITIARMATIMKTSAIQS